MEINNLNYENATTCNWQITTEESKIYTFIKTIIIEFDKIENVQA